MIGIVSAAGNSVAADRGSLILGPAKLALLTVLAFFIRRIRLIARAFIFGPGVRGRLPGIFCFHK
jgi:hypothetical protein